MSMSGNWVDLLIILVLAFFVFEGWRAGFWIMLANFLSFFVSLLVALRGYSWVAHFLENNFQLQNSFSNALGFLIVALLTESILGFIFARLIGQIPLKVLEHKLSRVLATLPALGEGLVVIAFVITLVTAVPVNPSIKEDISRSRIGGVILSRTSEVENSLNGIFGQVVEDALTYFTVKPNSSESVPLTVESYSLLADEKSELEMLELVNIERRKVGARELVLAKDAIPVARAHATDMWERKYFSHVSPDGKDVGDRLAKANIDYRLAGENLALAPTLKTAHTGLMNSEGHRENILEPKFKRLAIGVIDNGYYGKMFVQVFLD